MKYSVIAGLAFGLTVLASGCGERAYMAPRAPVYGEYEGYERVPYYRSPEFGMRPYGYGGWGEMGELED